MSTEAMSHDVTMPGRHRCRLCGTTWHCANLSCAPEKNEKTGWNETLNCLACDLARAEVAFDKAKQDMRKAQRTGFYKDKAAEYLSAVTNKVERLRAAHEQVYGGFTA